MINPDEERYILKQAWIPEHIPGLMAGVSGADFFLCDPFVGLTSNDWLVFVGYPLRGDFHDEAFEDALRKAMVEFKPARCWFIAPRIPAQLLGKVLQRESDDYYRLDLKALWMRSKVRNMLNRARRDLTVQTGRTLEEPHRTLITDFMGSQDLDENARHLFERIPDYLARVSTAEVLSAFDAAGHLIAFDIADFWPDRYVFYMFTFRSRAHVVPGASDLLLDALLRGTQERGKSAANLGLGINEGIAFFKGKWGGEASPNHEFLSFQVRPPSVFESFLRGLMG